jgi:hypothetical protein
VRCSKAQGEDEHQGTHMPLMPELGLVGGESGVPQLLLPAVAVDAAALDAGLDRAATLFRRGTPGEARTLARPRGADVTCEQHGARAGERSGAQPHGARFRPRGGLVPAAVDDRHPRRRL